MSSDHGHGGAWNGLALQLRRTLHGLSLEDLRQEMKKLGHDVSMSTIARWERDERAPSRPELADAMASIFHCSVLTFYRKPILTFDAQDDEA